MLKLEINLQEVPVKFFTFNGGEEQVVIDMSLVPEEPMTVEITAHLKSSIDVMRLVVLADAIRRIENYNAKFYLTMPYVPYARQDRVMQEGEALAIKSFANIINSLKFDAVLISDPHSPVTEAVLDNLVIRDQTDCFKQAVSEKFIFLSDDIVVIAPDAGARKKAAKTAKHYNWELIEAGKTRDVSTGEITGTEIYGDVAGKDCLILDDLCDGGMTFIKLGEALKAKGASNVRLYVTHGIFAKGKEVFKGNVDQIICLYDWTENF